MSRNSVRTTFSIPEEQHAKLAGIAEENDVSVAWVIRQAVQLYLDSMIKEEPVRSGRPGKRNNRA